MFNYIGRYWEKISDSKIQCNICPHHCKLSSGQRGRCFIRKNENHNLILTSYGYSSGFCIDPIEKKPLNHFYPGSSVLSFGTAGCNLSCKFCQNWSISKSRSFETLSKKAMPKKLAMVAKEHNCKSIAYTYNDPVIFFEYAIDTAIHCKELGVKNVAVTAGYITKEARKEFFSHMDAVNVDLKSFSNEFYQKITGSKLKVVLDTLIYIKQNTKSWLEITNLIIPTKNDSIKEINDMCLWVYKNLGDNTPIHFSAFHPDYKMKNIARTPLSTLLRAQKQALDIGLKYVYIGNYSHYAACSTYCYQCGKVLIERSNYQLTQYNIDDNSCCLNCGTNCYGVFEKFNLDLQWGNKREVVNI